MRTPTLGMGGSERIGRGLGARVIWRRIGQATIDPMPERPETVEQVQEAAAQFRHDVEAALRGDVSDSND